MSGDRRFERLREKAEAAGLELLRTDPQDGPQRFFVARRQTVWELRSVDDVEALVGHLQQGR